MLENSIFALDLNNIIMITKQKKILLLSDLIIFSMVLGLDFFEKHTGFFKWLDPTTLWIIVLVAMVFPIRFLRKSRKKKNGIPSDDELSILVKYKIGYYSFFSSSFLWYCLFCFKDRISDINTILGGGILLSVLIVLITSVVFKLYPDE